MMDYNEYLNSMEQEWKRIFDTDKDYYLYGAALNANRMLIMAKKTGVISKIKGCLVSRRDNNPKYCERIKVMPIADLHNKDAVILIPHMGKQREDILNLLKQYGFGHIVSVNKYYVLVDWKLKEEICDICMEKARQVEREMFENKTREDMDNDLSIYQKVIEMMQNQAVGFGGQVPYQSFERMGIPGVRPSQYRIIKYGLENILESGHNVLDIGCNVGFLDMSVAEMVHSVTGVEYEGNLVDVANLVKKYLGMENCFFIHKDFDSWYMENTKSYDVVFSFAIHHWLNLAPSEYMDRIDKILKKGGFICMESHVGEDSEYKKCLEDLLGRGYCMYIKGNIMDDAMREREWCLIKK